MYQCGSKYDEKSNNKTRKRHPLKRIPAPKSKILKFKNLILEK